MDDDNDGFEVDREEEDEDSVEKEDDDNGVDLDKEEDDEDSVDVDREEGKRLHAGPSSHASHPLSTRTSSSQSVSVCAVSTIIQSVSVPET